MISSTNGAGKNEQSQAKEAGLLPDTIYDDAFKVYQRPQCKN